MQKNLWIIIILVITFFGFMVGYSIPPFLEVGFGTGQQPQAGGQPEADLMKQYEKLYQDDNE